MIMRQPDGDSRHLRLRLFNRYAGLQSGCDLVPRMFMVVPGHVRRLQAPDVDPATEQAGVVVCRGNHADDDDLEAGELHRPADNTGVRAKVLMPEGIAQHDVLRVRIRLIRLVVMGKRAAQRCGDAHHRAKIGIDRVPVHERRGLPEIREARIAVSTVDAHSFKDAISLLLVIVVARRVRQILPFWRSRPDLHQAAGIREGERLQKEALQDRECRRVDANAKSQSY
jgi:hypothetical protein